MDLFLSFNGRIARGTWWIGAIILVVSYIVVAAVLGFLFGRGFIGGILTFALSLAVLYPAIALATKRLADRNKPPMPRLALFYGPGLLLSLMQSFGIGFNRMMVEGTVVMVPGFLAGVLGFVAMVAAIWALVELGFLKGDEGANNFGSAPA